MRYVSCALLVALASSSCSHDAAVSLYPRVAREISGATSATEYTIAYLPTLGGSRNRPSGISSNGFIAGFVNRPGNATRVAAFERFLPPPRKLWMSEDARMGIFRAAALALTYYDLREKARVTNVALDPLSPG